MSEDQRPVVIVQQSQSQWQNREGCCGGAGCDFILLIALALFPFAMLSSALQGEESLWWVLVSIILILIEVALVFAVVDHFLGLGIIKRLTERMDRANEETDTRKQEHQEGVNSENYGPVSSEWSQLARPVPHPDDPPQLDEVALPASEAVPRPDVYEQIRRLAEIRDEGLISSEEFEIKKRDLFASRQSR